MDMVKILIADDETRIRKLVGDFLRLEGYRVFEADNGKDALEKLYQEQDFDLLILDVMMPQLDGWSVCKEIRKSNPKIPIIMLTARCEEADELFGFDIGADEYITKPFSPSILVARVQALLRRAGNDKKTVAVYDGLEIDEEGYVVRVNGTPVDFSKKEFELLKYFMYNEGIALSREKILDALWSYDYFGDIRAVDQIIKRIREKLGIKGDYIQTVRGFGYKFEVKK
ncbi:MAG: response regulator transcription factor [Clostridiales bacterium]|nr:response regulator transcription factor [Eubacteriales bacterium]MDH7565884.1 response regulator transcription factor [Clostridiales bacterium]